MIYIKYFTSTWLFALVVFLLIGVYIQPVMGDLTRLGNLSERHFGWNDEQPLINVEDNLNINPDVVVLGDSFSDKNIWQSVASKYSKLNFLTFQWNGLDKPGCLSQWIKTVNLEYPTAKFIVLETVERQFISTFGSTPNNNCSATRLIPVLVREKVIESSRNRSIKSAMPDPIYAIQAIANEFKTFEQPLARGSAYVVPLTRADLFSNKKSGLMLFYKGDIAKIEWNQEAVNIAIQNIKNIDRFAREKGLTLLMAVVPDKSTAYREFIRSDQFKLQAPDVWMELNRQGVNQVDLRSSIVNAVNSDRDIYMSNDSHLSSKGYIVMGRDIADRIDILKAK